MRRIFPDYLFFLLGMLLVAFIGMWITYVYIFPSKQRFSQEQAIKDNRSPMYNRIVEMQDELMKMRETVEKLSEKVDRMAENK